MSHESSTLVNRRLWRIVSETRTRGRLQSKGNFLYGIFRIMKNKVIVTHQRYRYSKPVNRYEFFLDSNFNKDDIIFINKNKIISIVLNAQYYTFSNLDILREIPHIEFLDIVSERVTNFNGLRYLKKLKYLFISNPISDINIDLTQNINLEFLNIPTTNIKGIENCIRLSTLVLRKCKFDQIDYKMLPNLKSLDFVDSKKITDLNFLPNSLKVTQLTLSHLPNLNDISFISKIDKNLKELEIETCKKIRQIEIISTLKLLKKLVICNSIPLINTSVILPLNKLEHFALLGSSFFVDGDLSLLKKMNIKYVGIDDKKHYTLKMKDFRFL